MYQKIWFKTFIWFLTTSFFFLFSAILISIFSPPATEIETMKFMSGMMNAMDKSIMGITMTLENNPQLQTIITVSTISIIPIGTLSIILGILLCLIKKERV